MTLIELILNQYERSDKGKKGDLSGNSSFRVEEKHYKLLGKSTLVQEALVLEKASLLKIHWVDGYYKIDIEKLTYPITRMEEFYQKANRIPKYQTLKSKKDLIRGYYEQISNPWIRSYTEQELLPRLEKGRDQQEYEELNKQFQCFMGLDQLEAPMFKRIFSKKYLGNSKTFEKELQDKIIRIARRYHECVEDTMEDTEVLSQLNIEEYAQEMSIKGCLRIKVMDKLIDTGVFPFGTVLNTQTLKNAVILDNPQITKVLSFENKANFISEPYEEGTLILFTHGYFTPPEREFLKRLRDKLSDEKVSYYHSGDLDYGGVRIFQYIRKRIFPKLQPYQMDAETFDRYHSFGESIESGPLEKLKNIEEPLLKEVINRIIETGMVIEQEAFLLLIENS